MMMLAHSKKEKGSTLLLIAWILGIMGVIAVFLVYRTEVEWAAVSDLEHRNNLQQMAEEQLQESLALLAGDDTPTDSPKDQWYHGNGRVTLEQNGYRITLLIEDEGAKPNLNCLNVAGLKELAGVNQADAPISVDPILDWRDVDDNPISDSGAENVYYQSLNPPYQARNGFFSSPEELKELKDGPRLYSLIAPEVTVFGRVDPNQLDEDGMRSLLVSIGFDKTRADLIAVAFQNKRRTHRFDSATDFEPLSGMDLLRLSVLKPYIQFNSACNPNFMSRNGMAALLKNFGLDVQKAEVLIRQRDQEPFTDIGPIAGLLGLTLKFNGQPMSPSDYFTVISTVFRIRVWVAKNESRYYLETVQERKPARRGWRVYPLAWKSLLNQQVPEIPAAKVPGGESPDPEQNNASPSPGPDKQ